MRGVVSPGRRLGSYVARRLAVAALVLGGLALGVGAGHEVRGVDQADQADQADEAAGEAGEAGEAGGGVRADAAAGAARRSGAAPADRVARLLARHGCWTGPAPAGSPAPGHAVVTLPGARAELVAADVGFGIWLEHAPGTVHGFCP